MQKLYENFLSINSRSINIWNKIFSYRSNESNQKLEKEIFKIDMEIEKLKTDFSYVSSPQKLKNINDNQYKLIPIEQIDIIKIENK